MQRNPLKLGFARIGFALAASLCLSTIAGVTSAEDSETAAQRPDVKHPVSSNPSQSSTYSYWQGAHWDAQKGKSFWHSLKSEQTSAANRAKASAANGSLKVRDQRRARAAAANAKP